MWELNSEDVLYQLSFYELYRSDGTLTIKVLEALSESVCKYMAVPLLGHAEADEQYQGRGGSREEALNDCLTKIKDLTIVGQLFPRTVG
ncbi:hypothetical protein [Desulfogranum mediterraneum]|uniref:hypothetical protein n=1 Tax=Desulfogranum mediterraneum TaxID=160661 RepID=UPI00040C7EE9|nr:hypothetical protein [Desulfogranum mediterraneum]